MKVELNIILDGFVEDGQFSSYIDKFKAMEYEDLTKLENFFKYMLYNVQEAMEVQANESSH